MNTEKRIKSAELRKKRTLITLFILFFGLFTVFYVSRKKDEVLDSYNYVPGMDGLNKAYNCYDISVDIIDSDNVWFGTDAGLKKYNKNNGRWHTYSYHSGVPSRFITSIAQTTDKIWFGTWEGLSFLDRNSGKIKSLNKKDGLPSNRVFDVYTAGDNIYLGTSNGLGIYNRRKDSVKSFGLYTEYAGREVLSIASSKGLIYLGHDNGKISVIKPDGTLKDSLINRKSREDVFIWDLTFSEAGDTLFAATSDKGVWLYDMTESAWTFFDVDNGYMSRGAHTIAIVDNEIWAGHFNGIMRYNPEVGSWINMTNSDAEKYNFHVTAIENDEDYTWYGTTEYGAGKIFGEMVKWVPVNAGLTHDNIVCLQKSGDDIFTGFGYMGGGFDIISAKDFTWKRNVGSQSGNPVYHVTSFFRLGDTVFCGGYEGIAAFSKAGEILENAQTAEDALFGEPVGYLLYQNRIYFGDGEGLKAMNPADMSIKSVDNSHIFKTQSFCSDGATIYLGSYFKGVISFNLETGNKKSFADLPSPAKVTAVYNNKLWVFSDRISEASFGIADTKTGHILDPVEAADMPRRIKTILTETPAACAEVINGRLWIGTEDKGFLIYDSDKADWKILNHKNGLLNDHPRSVESYGPRIFTGMLGGLARLSGKALYSELYKNEN